MKGNSNLLFTEQKCKCSERVCVWFTSSYLVIVINMIMPDVACSTRLCVEPEKVVISEHVFLQSNRTKRPAEENGLRGFWICWRPVSDAASHHLRLLSHSNLSRYIVFFEHVCGFIKPSPPLQAQSLRPSHSLAQLIPVCTENQDKERSRTAMDWFNTYDSSKVLWGDKDIIQALQWAGEWTRGSLDGEMD